MRGKRDNKYPDFVSEDEGMTFLVTLHGCAQAPLEPCFMVFKNITHTHPIVTLKDDFPSVVYLSSPTDCMYFKFFMKWF